MKDIVYITPSNDLVIDLAQTIASWLIYNSSVSGRIGVQENMIDAPVKSFLVCHQNEWEKATFEEKHPHLCRRRIDFYLESKKKEEYFFEFKQAKEDTEDESEVQRIYNDIIRLAICKKENPKRRCIFLMFGDIESYTKFFIKSDIHEMKYSDCFYFYKQETNEEKQIHPKSGEITQSNGDFSNDSLISKFLNDYKPRISKEDLLEVNRLSPDDKEERIKQILLEIIPSDCYIKLVWTNLSYEQDVAIPDVVGIWEILTEATPDISTKMTEKTIDDFIDASTGVNY